jgi:hypothetical protein
VTHLGPLSGIHVVELGVVIAGPSAAAILGDWGADVVKVEPAGGDPQRGNTQRAYFELDNRGKRSLTIDLKTDRGRELLTELIERADVFVTNIRAGALGRLGLDPARLMARNRRLVATAPPGRRPTNRATTSAPSGHALASPRRSSARATNPTSLVRASVITPPPFRWSPESAPRSSNGPAPDRAGW